MRRQSIASSTLNVFVYISWRHVVVDEMLNHSFSASLVSKVWPQSCFLGNCIPYVFGLFTPLELFLIKVSRSHILLYSLPSKKVQRHFHFCGSLCCLDFLGFYWTFFVVCTANILVQWLLHSKDRFLNDFWFLFH